MAHHEAERPILRHGEIQRAVSAHVRADCAHDEWDNFDEFARQLVFARANAARADRVQARKSDDRQPSISHVRVV